MQRASVDVQVLEFRSRPISVIGAVKQPGNLGFSGRWTLLEAITAAGGLAENHGNVVYILRRADNGLSDQVAIDLDDLLVRADPRVNIPIFANDLINVPGAVEVTIYCLGEVAQPGALTFKSTERITLLTAIAHAGGLTDRALEEDPDQAGRPAPTARPPRSTVDYKRILAGKAPGRRAAPGRRHRRQGVLLLSRLTPSPIDDEPELAGRARVRVQPRRVRRHAAAALEAGRRLLRRRPRRRRRPLRHHAQGVPGDDDHPDRAPQPDAAQHGQNPWLENYWNMEFYPTQYELLQSRGLAERVVKSLDLMEDPAFNPGAGGERGEGAHGPTAEDDDAVLGSLADQIRGGLAVEPVRSTQLVQLSFRAASPEFAAKAANAFAEAYIDMGVEDRYATAGKASTFLSSQIETLKQEIQDKETQLQAFSRRSDIVTLDPGSNVTLKRLEALNAQYIEAKKTAHRARGRSTTRRLNGPRGVDGRQPARAAWSASSGRSS